MDNIKKRHSGLLFAILGAVLFYASQGFAYGINDKFSIGGIIAGVYQYQSLSDAPDYRISDFGLRIADLRKHRSCYQIRCLEMCCSWEF